MRLERDWQWGFKTGLAFATMYSLFAVFVFVLSGGQAFRDKDISLMKVVAAYYGGGALAGSLVGLLRPLAATLPGAILVGIAGFVAVSLGIGLVVFGWFLRWGPDEVITVAIMSVVFGGIFGATSWQRQKRLGSSDDR